MKPYFTRVIQNSSLFKNKTSLACMVDCPNHCQLYPISPSFSPYLHHSLPDGTVNIGWSLGLIMRVYLSLLIATDLLSSNLTHWRPLHFLKNKPTLSTPTLVQSQTAQGSVVTEVCWMVICHWADSSFPKQLTLHQHLPTG